MCKVPALAPTIENQVSLQSWTILTGGQKKLHARIWTAHPPKENLHAAAYLE